MSSYYHAIVWIDHHEARVFHFNVSEVDRLTIHPEHPTRHIHRRQTASAAGTRPRTMSSCSAFQRPSATRERSS